MKTRVTSSVSLAEEMVRYMFGNFFASFRILEKTVRVPMLEFAPIRIVDITGTVLTERGEGQFSSSAVVCREGRDWVPKWCVFKNEGTSAFQSGSYPLRLSADGIRIERVPHAEELSLLEKYHPQVLRPPVDKR